MPKKFTRRSNPAASGWLRLRLRVPSARNANAGSSRPNHRRRCSYTAASAMPLRLPNRTNCGRKIFRILAVPISDPITCRAKITAAMSEKTLTPRKKFHPICYSHIPSILYVLQPPHKTAPEPASQTPGNCHGKPIIHIHRCRVTAVTGCKSLAPGQQIAPRGSCSQIIPPCGIDAELPRNRRGILRNLRRQLTPSPRNPLSFQLSDECLSRASCPPSCSFVLVAPASRRLSCGRPRPLGPSSVCPCPTPPEPQSRRPATQRSWLGSLASRTFPPGSGCSLNSTRTLRSGSSNAGKLATCSSEYRVCSSVSVFGSMSFHEENHPGSKRPNFSARSSVLNSSQIVGRCVTSVISSPLVDTINLFPFGCVSI